MGEICNYNTDCVYKPVGLRRTECMNTFVSKLLPEDNKQNGFLHSMWSTQLRVGRRISRWSFVKAM